MIKAVFLMLALLMMTGCSSMSSEVKMLEGVVVDCALPTLEAKVPEIMAEVTAILTGVSTSWELMLLAFAKQFGSDVVACAVKKASADLQAKIPASISRSTTGVLTPELKGMNRAKEFMSKHDFKYKE